MVRCQHKLFKQIQALVQAPTQAPSQALMGARRPEAAEKCPTRDEAAEKCPDARRVAPIRAQFPGITVLSLASNPLFNLSI